MKNKKSHECIFMKEALDDQRVYMGYSPKYREYYINTDHPMIVHMITHCPWCGKELPESVREEWFDILEKEYHLDDPYDDEQEKLIPEEFKTDDWWKRRGL